MKITVFNGSPRGEKSNTHVMVKEFLAGAEEAGAETENIFLVEKKIQPCMGCFACWLKTPGKCAIKDDMEELLEKQVHTDITVYACPVYVGSVTGIMKNFIDRNIPLADPHLIQNETGTCCHPSRYSHENKVVLISNCGFPEQTHFKYFRNIFEYMESNSGGKIIAEIYRGEGELLRIDDLFINIIVGEYKKLLRKAGKEVVENLELSEKTKAALEKPLIPYEQYMGSANKHWNSILDSIKV